MSRTTVISLCVNNQQKSPFSTIIPTSPWQWVVHETGIFLYTEMHNNWINTRIQLFCFNTVFANGI